MSQSASRQSTPSGALAFHRSTRRPCIGLKEGSRNFTAREVRSIRYAPKQCTAERCRMNHYCRLGIVVLFGLTTPALWAEERPKQITILFDAFSKSPDLKKDWGFAALVEYGGKRILFDTGNNSDMFAHNLKQLKVDVMALDCVVISHRHGDHTNGLLHLLKVRP